MSPLDANVQKAIDEIANALQTAVLLAGKLATGLRADAHDADLLYQALRRATDALRSIRPIGGGQ